MYTCTDGACIDDAFLSDTKEGTSGFYVGVVVQPFGSLTSISCRGLWIVGGISGRIVVPLSLSGHLTQEKIKVEIFGKQIIL